MDIEEYFKFGRYKGLRLIDVYRGTLNINKQLIKDYINHLLNTKARFSFEKTLGSTAFECVDEFEVSEQEIKTLTLFHTGFDEYGEPVCGLFEMTDDVESDLQLCLSIGNQKAGYAIGDFCSLAEFSKNYNVRLVVGADPQYLCWCIENVDSFFISENDIDNLEKLKIVIFHGIDVMRKDGGIYEYTPNLEIKRFRFPESVKQLNQSKNERLALENEENYKEDHDDRKYDDGPAAYGYNSWEEMSFYEAYEGDSDAWAHDNQ